MLRFDQDVVAGIYPIKTIQWDEDAVGRARAGEPLECAPLRDIGMACEAQELEFRDGFYYREVCRDGIYDDPARSLRADDDGVSRDQVHGCPYTTRTPSASPNQYALFDCMIEPETGHYLSEDYTFCRRWRSIGGKVWLDTEGALTHIGTHEFAGRPGLRRPAAAA